MHEFVKPTPKKVKAMGELYKVHNVNFDDNRYGDCDKTINLIRLNVDSVRFKKWGTLFHEMFHVVTDPEFYGSIRTLLKTKFGLTDEQIEEANCLSADVGTDEMSFEGVAVNHFSTRMFEVLVTNGLLNIFIDKKSNKILKKVAKRKKKK